MSFTINKEHIEYLFELCKNSYYVKHNYEYNKKAIKTSIELESNNDSINAYASVDDNSITDSDNEHDVYENIKYKIVIFNGIVNIMIPVSYALAIFKQTNNTQILVDMMNIITNNIDSKHTRNNVYDQLAEFNYDINNYYIKNEALSFHNGMILAIIAHELGHICLNHIVRHNGDYETSRNDERSADLFSHSVIATTPFKGYTILADLFTEILFTWLSKSDKVITTHPNSKERVYNTFNSHSEYLDSIGINKDIIELFLP